MINQRIFYLEVPLFPNDTLLGKYILDNKSLKWESTEGLEETRTSVVLGRSVRNTWVKTEF